MLVLLLSGRAESSEMWNMLAKSKRFFNDIFEIVESNEIFERVEDFVEIDKLDNSEKSFPRFLLDSAS